MNKGMKKTESNLPSNADVNQFLMLRELAEGLYNEMKDLTKKYPPMNHSMALK